MKKIKYLGYTITKRKNIRGNTVYEVSGYMPQKTLLAAKKIVIGDSTKGKKIKLADRTKLKEKVASIKTLTDLNREISKLNKTMATKKKTTTSRKSTSAKKLCRSVVAIPGINKRTGQLLKGWKYVNGKPVKASSKAKKTVTKRKTTAKKK